MTKYIELNTIGVSKDSQIRAAKILNHVADSIEHGPESKRSDNFFEFGYNLMALRWAQLRAAVHRSDLFSLPSFPSGTCRFSSHHFKPQPGNLNIMIIATLDFSVYHLITNPLDASNYSFSPLSFSFCMVKKIGRAHV